MGAAVEVFADDPADAVVGLGEAGDAGPELELVQAAMMSARAIVPAIGRERRPIRQLCPTPRAVESSVVRIDDNLDS